MTEIFGDLISNDRFVSLRRETGVHLFESERRERNGGYFEIGYLLNCPLV